MVDFVFKVEIRRMFIMADKRVLVLIPARYASSRFPGKPLTLLKGKSMIQRVFENCSEANALQGMSNLNFSVAVVTDDQRIEDHVLSFGGEVVRVDDPVESGTERINLAWQRFYHKDNFDLLINVQGDEPLLNGQDLVDIALFHLNSEFDIATLVKEEKDWNDFADPNRVKAVLGTGNKCLYFSRAKVPFNRDEDLDGRTWLLHVGVYSYLPEALKKFCAYPMSQLEKIEKLEQLRALENNLTIGAMKTIKTFMGVDTPEDVHKLEGVLK